LLLLEIGSRIWVNYLASDEQARRYKLGIDMDPGSLQWSPHHYLNYFPTPNYRRGKTSHNSLGYRDKEFPVKKPVGKFRIVALGGSTTYTIEVEDNDKMFTRQLQNVLRDSFGYDAVEVINAGVGGYNSWESLMNLEFRVLDLNPDLIIVYHGTNDVHTRLVARESYKGDNSGRRKQWSAPYVSPAVQHSYLVRIISSKLDLGLFRREGLGSYVNAPTYKGQGSSNPSTDPMVLLEVHPPSYFRRNLTNMVVITRAHGADILLSTWAHSPYFNDYASTAYYQRGFQENNAVIREVAAERGVRLFDFAKKMPKSKEYWSDGRHVNEKGALAKAQLFADFLHKSGLLDATRSLEQKQAEFMLKEGPRTQQ
jgi:lysophospholipase L1-like esterase